MSDRSSKDNMDFPKGKSNRRERKLINRKELIHHEEAFLFYRNLCSGRSYKAVVHKFGRSNSTIKNWSKWFQWRNRIQEWEEELTRKMTEATNKCKQDGHEAHRKHLNNQLALIIMPLKEGKIKFTARDLIRLESLAERLEVLIDYLENPNRLRITYPIVVLPDNGMNRSDKDIDNSQITEIDSSGIFLNKPHDASSNIYVSSNQKEDLIAYLEYGPNFEDDHGSDGK